MENCQQSANDLVVIFLLTADKWAKRHESSRRVYSSLGLSPTIYAIHGGGIEPKVAVLYE